MLQQAAEQRIDRVGKPRAERCQPIGATSNPTVPPVRNDLLNTARPTLIEESMGCEDDQATLQDG
jgi:hypothetical protein